MLKRNHQIMDAMENKPIKFQSAYFGSKLCNLRQSRRHKVPMQLDHNAGR